jgi:hypothetical protein
MNKKILWIDDDYYAIQGLFRPIEMEGYKLDVALSALDGYHKAQKWKEYSLIVVDLIIPISQQYETTPDVVNSWENEVENDYVGIGLAKWLLRDIRVKCPVLILSIVPDPTAKYNLDNLGLAGYIQKSGLLPSTLKDKVLEVLRNHSVSSS